MALRGTEKGTGYLLWDRVGKVACPLFSFPQQITYAFVLKRISNPFWKAFDLLFLVTILFHGFNGLWGIALEYAGAGRMLKVFQGIILVSVGALLLTGIYIITL